MTELNIDYFSTTSSSTTTTTKAIKHEIRSGGSNKSSITNYLGNIGPLNERKNILFAPYLASFKLINEII